MTEPLPLCETCGLHRVKRRYRGSGIRIRFCSHACVPKAVHHFGGKIGRKRAAQTFRARRFRDDVKRFREQGGKLTHADLIDLLWVAYERGYQAGYRSKMGVAA
jgi:hypothetical protein